MLATFRISSKSGGLVPAGVGQHKKRNYRITYNFFFFFTANIVDGNITRDSVTQNPNNGFSSEVVRFLNDYLKVKPDNLKHTDIRVLS